MPGTARATRASGLKSAAARGARVVPALSGAGRSRPHLFALAPLAPKTGRAPGESEFWGRGAGGEGATATRQRTGGPRRLTPLDTSVAPQSATRTRRPLTPDPSPPAACLASGPPRSRGARGARMVVAVPGEWGARATNAFPLSPKRSSSRPTPTVGSPPATPTGGRLPAQSLQSEPTSAKTFEPNFPHRSRWRVRLSRAI